MQRPMRRTILHLVVVILCTSQLALGLSDRTKYAVRHLWRQVEENVQVDLAKQQTVIDTPSHIDIGFDPSSKNPFKAHTLTESRIDHLKFKKHFMYGVASAAPQVEGAVKSDYRGPSIWDSYCHLIPQNAQNDTVPCQAMDIGTNFRYLYPLDIARVAAMGVKSYSFSVSWSRVMPLGHGDISEEGLQFYEDLVQEIIDQGMKPVATLFHWDLPLQLEIRYGGFTSDVIVDQFARYAGIIFEALGKKGVKTFFTFNEPQEFCMHRYPLTQPHVHGKSVAEPSLPWQCAGHLLKAHGKAVELFRQLKANHTISSKAKISYKNAGAYNLPYRKHNKQDKQAVKRSTTFYLDLFARPIHKTGDYPPLVKEEVPSEWLPRLTKQDKESIKGSADFFATDFYATSVSKATEQNGGFDQCVANVNHPNWPACSDYTATNSDGQLLGEKSDTLTETWLMNTAGTLRRHLKYIYDEYKSDEIIVSEIGWAERGQGQKTNLADIRDDQGRQRYYRDHLAEMLLAVYKDGVPLTGCFAWSATDNVEWEFGTQPHFGLQSVDYSNPDLPRMFLNSFFYIRNFFKKHL